MVCIAIDGYKLWFPSEDHNPPHFHILRRGEWEYRVMFLEAKSAMVQKKWGRKSMVAKFKNELFAMVHTRLDTLLEEWESKTANPQNPRN